MVKLIPKNLPQPKSEDILDVAQIAVIGAFINALSAPYLGGGSLKSGAMKIGAGYAVSKFVGGGQLGRLLAGGLVFSGVFDGVNALGLSDIAAGFGTRLGGVGPAQVEDNW
jgi:hypothetical protein